MSDQIDSIITNSAPAVRKSQFCQQVKMTEGAPANITKAQAQYTASKANLKSRILDAQVIADLGADYAAIKAAVDAL